MEQVGPFSAVFERGELRVPGYLPLLHLDPEDECLVVFGRVQRALAAPDSDDGIRALLADPNWRPHLVAAVALSLRGTADGATEQLWAAMDGGSWVTPQLAAVAKSLDPDFESNAKRRIADPTARSSKMLASLVALLVPEPAWLDEALQREDVQGAMSSDVDNGAGLASRWALRLASLHTIFPG